MHFWGRELCMQFERGAAIFALVFHRVLHDSLAWPGGNFIKLPPLSNSFFQILCTSLFRNLYCKFLWVFCLLKSPCVSTRDFRITNCTGSYKTNKNKISREGFFIWTVFCYHENSPFYKSEKLKIVCSPRCLATDVAASFLRFEPQHRPPPPPLSSGIHYHRLFSSRVLQSFTNHVSSSGQYFCGSSWPLRHRWRDDPYRRIAILGPPVIGLTPTTRKTLAKMELRAAKGDNLIICIKRELF